MAQVIAYEDAKANLKVRDFPGGHKAWRTEYIPRTREGPDGPEAFLVTSTPRRVLPTHFHESDQFQIIALGGGTLAKHKLEIGGVHFSRAYTPYGPIINGDQGIGFVTLRARRGGAAQDLPENAEKLKSLRKRDPWQVTEMTKFKALDYAEDFSVVPFEHMKDDRGLAGYGVTVRANAAATAPAPSKDGQYIVVTKGSLLHQGLEKKGLSVVWVGGDEKAFVLRAGPEGLEAIVVNFPRAEFISATQVQTKNRGAFKTWQCTLCAVVYDEAVGMPEHGIPAGTLWEDVPVDFRCPDCDAQKSDFEMIEI